MNYFPPTGGWDALWLDYSHQQSAEDFAKIAALGANTVRIIVQPSAVGYPVVSDRGAAELADLTHTAAANGLFVQLTLFDGWSSYGQVAQSKEWLTGLLKHYADSSRVALVEVQNEIKPTNAAAISWATQMLVELHVLLPRVPRTLSVAGGSASGPRLTMLLNSSAGPDIDVVDMHLYGSWSAIVSALNTAVRDAYGRPVIVGETGRASYPAGSDGAQEAQRYFYDAVFHLCAAMKLPPPSPWIFSDLVDNQFSPKNPAEMAFGLVRRDGSLKPAAQVVIEGFGASQQGKRLAAGLQSTDGGFEHEARTPFQDVTFGAWRAANASAARMVGVVSGHARNGVLSAELDGTTSVGASLYETLPVYQASRSPMSASAYVDTADATGSNRIALAYFDSTGAYLFSDESPVARTGVHGWQLLEVSGRPPNGAAMVGFYLKSDSNTGSVYFDETTIFGYFTS